MTGDMLTVSEKFVTMFGRDVEAKRPRSVLLAAISVSGCSLSSKDVGAVLVINVETMALKSGLSEREIC